MSRYSEKPLSFEALRTVPIESRGGKVQVADFAKPYKKGDGPARFLESLPKILAGDLHFCIGYSEPEAGTDLANLKCRADIDGEELIINGQKLWTSLAGDADWCWLAVRTNQEAKKHKGISMVLVPLKDENGNRTEGIEIQPLHLMGDHDINAVFYTDVRVPIANVVGGVDQGWNLITNQLNHERVTLCSSGVLERMLDHTREWAQNTKLADGSRVIDQEWVQMTLARVHTSLEFLRLINWKVSWTATQGHLDVADARPTVERR